MPPPSSHFAEMPVPAPPPMIGSPRRIMSRKRSTIALRSNLGMLALLYIPSPGGSCRWTLLLKHVVKLACDAAAEHEHAENEDEPDDDGHPGAERIEIGMQHGDQYRADGGSEYGRHASEQGHQNDFAGHVPMHVGECGELK